MVKTIRELIYWEYAKLISGSSMGDRKCWGFVTHTYKKLCEEKIHPSQIIKENKKMFDTGKVCAYCGGVDCLEWDHIIPKVKCVIDTFDNQVMCCKHCNCSKGGRDPFEWYGRERMYEIPRLVLGKYLKLIYEIHEKQETLDMGDLDGDGELNVYDLGVIINKEII